MNEPNSLSHLDDPDPPALDDGRWERIRHRSRAIVRRRRVALTTAGTAAIVAVILGAATLAVVAQQQNNRVVTVGRLSPSTAVAPSPAFVVRLEVDNTVVNQGQDVTGTLVFEIRSHRAVSTDFNDWQVVVGSGTSKPAVMWPYSLTGGPSAVFRPGVTRTTFRAATRTHPVSCVESDSLLPCGELLPAGPARVWFVTNSTDPNVVIPAPVAITIAGRGGPPPQPEPCPVPSPEPSMATGQFCGPVPPSGNGLGANGECTGRETTVPCAAGVVPGKYYAFTLPGRCDGVIIFDGRRWISELPPPTDVPDFDVWMRLDPNGRLGFIGPRGAVGFDPDTGQARGVCTG